MSFWKALLGMKIKPEEQTDEASREYTIPTPRSARIETVKAVANRAAMRIDARNEPDDELFEELFWARKAAVEYLAKKVMVRAQAGDTSYLVNIECEPYKPDDFAYSITDGIADVRITAKIKDDRGNKRLFETEKQMWQFFYQLAEWIPNEFEKNGYQIRMGYGNEEGWNDKFTEKRFYIAWNDDDLDRNLQHVYDPSQARGYEEGLSLQDLFLGEPIEKKQSRSDSPDFLMTSRSEIF